MDFLTLYKLIEELKQSPIEKGEMTKFILESLTNPQGPVYLISGELHPGAYNDRGIGEALHQLLKEDKHPVTICWGPTTFFTLESDKRRNDLYTGILGSLDASSLSIYHSRFRQDSHMWVIGDKIIYQYPHRPGAEEDEKTTMIGRNVPGIGEHIKNDLESQNGVNGNLSKVKNSQKDIEKIFRSVNIKLNQNCGIEDFLNSAQPEEAIEFFLSFIKSFPESFTKAGLVQCFSKNPIEIVTYIIDRDSDFKHSNKVINAEFEVESRYPDLTFDFQRYRVEEDQIENMKSEKETVYIRG